MAEKVTVMVSAVTERGPRRPDGDWVETLLLSLPSETGGTELLETGVTELLETGETELLETGVTEQAEANDDG